jgi:hypothetical protein
VIAMRAWWILPNRDQSDDVLASDGKTILPLRRVLDPKLRPEGFSHGVPAELIERCGSTALREILFAQRFPGWNGNNLLFSLSTPAGADSSGRVVHLGLLFILEPHEHPRFELPYDGLSKEDQAYARALIHRLTSPEPRDSWARSVRELGGLPPGGGPATNVALERSAARFDSLYEAGPAGLARKSRFRRKPSLAAIVLLLLFAGAWLYERACEPSSRTPVRTGVVTWPLS